MKRISLDVLLKDQICGKIATKLHVRGSIEYETHLSLFDFDVALYYFGTVHGRFIHDQGETSLFFSETAICYLAANFC